MHLERGNLLGQSTRCIMPWASNQLSAEIEIGGEDEIITTSTKPAPQQQCLLKLYDKNIREFKLNDFVTFIGILEYTKPPAVDPHGDSQMTDYAQEADDLPLGIPNEDKLPKLHVISYRRNHVLNSIKQLPKPEINKDYIKEHSQQIKEAHEKIIAVLKLILKNDKLAADFTLLGLISRVYLRESGLLIGSIQPNLAGITQPQAKLLE